MKRWARPCRRRAIRPRRARCHASCHRSSIRGTRRFAASIKMATSRGAARCLSPPRSPITPSHSKRSMTASGPSPLPRSSSGASTNAVTRFTLLPRFRGGAPPAPLAPRPTGRTKNDDDDNRRLTVTYVVGLLCYPCPRPPNRRSKVKGQRSKVRGKVLGQRYEGSGTKYEGAGTRREFLQTAATTAATLLTSGLPSGWVGGIYADDGPETKTIRFGIIALTDCAPIVMAHELGYFKKFGIESIISK